MFHSQLIFLREIFQKNGCLKNFIDKCFKVFLNRSENVPTVEENLLQLALPNLETLSLHTRTKLQK